MLAEFFQKIVAFFVAIFTALGLITPAPKVSGNFIMMINPIIDEPVEGQPTDSCRTLQGGCCDGQYYYCSITDPRALTTTIDPNSQLPVTEKRPCYILKIDTTTWTVVKTSEKSYIDHANDMTFDTLNNRVVVCNNEPNYTTLTFLDPETLSVTETKTVSRNVYAITYVGDSSCYYCGISGTYDYVEFNENFEETRTISGISNNLTRQGLASDGSYLYSIFYQEKTNVSEDTNYIFKYDFEGTYLGKCELPKSSLNNLPAYSGNPAFEAENIFFIGETLYVGYNVTGASNGGMIYTFENVNFVQ